MFDQVRPPLHHVPCSAREPHSRVREFVLLPLVFLALPFSCQPPSCPEQPCRCARPLTPWQARPRDSSTDFCKRRTRSLANGKRRLRDRDATELLIWLDAAHARSPMANGDYATNRLIPISTA